MNIKEHIEAGHYPTDSKGRALVPVQGTLGKWTATICAIDGPGKHPIVGFGLASALTWSENGCRPNGSDEPLLPPTPRKIPVKAWGYRLANFGYNITTNPMQAESWGEAGRKLVTFTGEDEEVW